MPGKKRDPQKQYDPNWGGRRPGTGSEPKNEQPRQVLIIAATPEEKEWIEANLTTRQRTEILLQYIERTLK